MYKNQLNRFRRKIIFSLFFSFFMMTSLGASTLSLAGEYLYFKPILDNTYYGIILPPDNTIQGTRLTNQYEFSSGYRIEGAYSFCSDRFDLRFRGSSLNSSHTDTISAQFIQLVNYPDLSFSFEKVTARSALTFNYTSYDGLIGWRMGHSSLTGGLYLGLHYVKVYNEQNDIYTGFSAGTFTTLNGLWATKTQGIGPEVTLLGEYFLPTPCWLPLQLVGRLQFGGIVVESGVDNKNQLKTAQSSIDFDFVNDKVDNVVPFGNFRLGLGSQYSLCVFLIDISLGYEIFAYYKLLNRTLIARASAGPTYDFYSDLYLHGLFLNVGIHY